MIHVAAAIIQHQSKILLARRAAHKPQAGYWEFPGGKIEEGESPEACLKRELLEELNISVRVKAFLMDHQCDYGPFQILLKGYW